MCSPFIVDIAPDDFPENCMILGRRIILSLHFFVNEMLSMKSREFLARSRCSQDVAFNLWGCTHFLHGNMQTLQQHVGRV